VKFSPPKFPVKLFKELEPAENWSRAMLAEFLAAQVEDNSDGKDRS